MKNKKICLLIFIFIFYFSFLLEENLATYNKQVDMGNRSIVPLLSANNSMGIEWYKIWNRRNNIDYGNGVAVDSEDNIYIVGSSEGSAIHKYDIVLVKYNSAGIQEWNTTWRGEVSNEGYGLVIDSSNNIYIVGSTNSLGAENNNVVLIKYSSLGVQEWNKTWDGGGSDEGLGIAVDSKDDIYITGYTQSLNDDIFLAKYDSSGEQKWIKTWDGGDKDHGYGIAVDSSDNIYIIGSTNSSGAGRDDIVLVKYNSAGILVWNTTWGIDVSNEGYGVVVDSEDNIYITGYTRSLNDDIVLAKYNRLGVQEWIKTWGGTKGDIGFGITVDSSDNIYIVGRTDSWGYNVGNLVLVKYNKLGILEWNKTLAGGGTDEGYGVAVDSENNIYITGYTINLGEGQNDIVLVKYSIDSDSDNLSDWQEKNIYFTDPNDSDTDNDNLSDYDEIFTYYTDPKNPDSDGDGLSDGQEVNIDSDSDGLMDWQEENIYLTDSNNSDTDNDGLLDGEEVNIYSTDPKNPDSDDDGFSDGLEVFWGSDPNDAKTPLIVIIIVCVVLTISIIITIFIIISHKRKKGKRERERLESQENEIKQELVKIHHLINENKFIEYIKKLEECKRTAERVDFTPLIREIDSLTLKAKSLIKKKKQEIKKDLVKIQSLLDEKKFNEYIKKLEEYKKITEREGFTSLIKETDSLLLNAKSHFKEFKIYKIKKTVLDLGTKFTRLKIIEIAEKCGLKDQQVIIDTVLNMIEKNEIYADYFSISKSIAFNQQANIEEIDRLMAAYKDWEDKKVRKK